MKYPLTARQIAVFPRGEELDPQGLEISARTNFGFACRNESAMINAATA